MDSPENAPASPPTVFVIDDDPEVLDSLRWLLESAQLAVDCFASAQTFLDGVDGDRPGCLVLDVRMQGMSGLELQRVLVERELEWPVIVITGHADVPMAIQALKAGAVEFIQKPFEDQRLLECVREALEADARARGERLERARIAARIETLTRREHEIMERVVDGGSNRAMAEALGVSAKTIEAHRASVMRKMEAGNVADLVRMYMILHGRRDEQGLESS